jgi:GDP-L-fucose synthase
MLNQNDKILVTGGTGLIGKNLSLRLQSLGLDVLSIGSTDDLRSASITKKVFDSYRPTVVYHLAAKVGGIYANSNYKPAFYSDNVLINTNVINACAEMRVRYVFAMGTGCAYPKRLEDNILHEENFLDGVPEATNDAYAYAKRGLLVHLKSLADSGEMQYLYCLPANIYGPHDNYHPVNSHVVPGLIRRFCDAVDQKASTISIWGDGSARRDFLYIEDCIDAMILLTQRQITGVVNVSTNKLTSIRDLAMQIGGITKYNGAVLFDKTQLTGQLQRIFDPTKMSTLGWHAKTQLNDGIEQTVDWFRANQNRVRER